MIHEKAPEGTAQAEGTVAAAAANTPEAIRARVFRGRVSVETLASSVLLALLARTVLFGGTQAMAALLFLLVGSAEPWEASIRWWPVTAVLTNIATLALLVVLAGREGLTLRDLYHFDRRRVGRDVLVGLAFIVLGAPVAALGTTGLTQLLYAGVMPPFMFALPLWAALAVSVLFPITVALSELPAYMGYALPRLEALTGRTWLAVLVAAFFLAFQHVALPLVFDARYMLWRGLAFVPLALLVAGLYVATRRLFPLMITHGLLDTLLGFSILALSLAPPG